MPGIITVSSLLDVLDVLSRCSQLTIVYSKVMVDSIEMR